MHATPDLPSSFLDCEKADFDDLSDELGVVCDEEAIKTGRRGLVEYEKEEDYVMKR